MTEPEWRGGDVAAGVTCVLAKNPGLLTLTGTNTWLLAAPGSARCVVVDPGPDDVLHLGAVRQAAADHGWTVEGVLVTHGHADHAQGVPQFAAMTGAATRAAEPAHCVAAQPLVGGDRLDLAGLWIEVVATPGHTADSLSFVVDSLGLIVTGDTVLGSGTSFVAHPEGRLSDYLTSLDRLVDLASSGLDRLLPGHGPVVQDAASWLRFYRSHRDERLDQVRQALAGGAASAQEVLDVVYGELPPQLRAAALASTRAQLAYLDETS